MIPKLCGACGQQRLEKLASLYWAWLNTDGRRRAWKQACCADCFAEHFRGAVINAMEPVLTCPVCGESTVDDYDAVYLTYCLPGMPRGQSELPLCGAHAVMIRELALRGARPLVDREVGVGGPQPTAPTGAEQWAALGLDPRVAPR